ncbi:MAG: glycoside hydrolase family protein [Spirochaetales bacterium]|nr:glycoside hydrolase family protein [Spirochaetales bacterium]
MFFKKKFYFFLVLLLYVSCVSNNLPVSEVVLAGDDLNIQKMVQPLRPENIFRDSEYFNWCNSLIKEGDKYYLVYSRWPRKFTFFSWLTHSEVALAVSDSPSGPFSYVKTLISCRGDFQWNRVTAHNPKIKKFDGKYYIYYIGTHGVNVDDELVETARVGYDHPNWNILRRNQRTGVAVADSIEGPFVSVDLPVVEPSGPIETLTVNPAVLQGRDGRFYMIVKGDKPGTTKFERNQAVAVAESPEGPFVVMPQPAIEDFDTEDVSVWYDSSRDLYYGIYHAHTYLGLIVSKDFISWQNSAFPVASYKRLKQKGKPALRAKRLERPFVYFEDGKPTVLIAAVHTGDDSFIVFMELKDF